MLYSLHLIFIKIKQVYFIKTLSTLFLVIGLNILICFNTDKTQCYFFCPDLERLKIKILKHKKTPTLKNFIEKNLVFISIYIKSFNSTKKSSSHSLRLTKGIFPSVVSCLMTYNISFKFKYIPKVLFYFSFNIFRVASPYLGYTSNGFFNIPRK